MITAAIDKINRENLRKDDQSRVDVGQLVDVHCLIREGDKERIQVFSGLVIAKKGSGSTETFTVRRVSHGVGVEKVFPVHSPHVAKVVVKSSGRTKRAKLYYMRRRTGRQSRLREKIG